MLSKEDILDMLAKDKMVDWNIRSFKQKFPSLFAVINQSMEQYATQKRVELIEGLKAIQAACDGKDLIWGMAEKIIKDAKKPIQPLGAVWKEKAEVYEKALKWYKDQADLAKATKDKDSLLSIVTALQLDGGARATKALEQWK